MARDASVLEHADTQTPPDEPTAALALRALLVLLGILLLCCL